MAVQVLGPAAAAVGEVLTVGDQALVQVAGEQRDAVGSRVVAEKMAGHADLAAAAGAEHLLIEPGPVLDRLQAGGLQTGDLDRHHGDFRGRSPIAGVRGFCRLRPMLDTVPSVQGGGSMLRELLLAFGIPLALLLLAVLALERWGNQLPPWLQR